MNVERVGDDAAREWDAFVDTAQGASVYHLYAWRRLIGAVFGHESLYLAARDARGRICGVLPLVRLRSVLFGDFMVSMPYFNYGGVLAESDESAAALLSEATTRARELGVSHVELRHVGNVRPDWPVRTDKVAMYLALARDARRIEQAPGREAALADQATDARRRDVRVRRARVAARVLRRVRA